MDESAVTDGLASTISRAVVAALILIDAGVGAAQQPRRSNVSAVTNVTANVSAARPREIHPRSPSKTLSVTTTSNNSNITGQRSWLFQRSSTTPPNASNDDMFEPVRINIITLVQSTVLLLLVLALP